MADKEEENLRSLLNAYPNRAFQLLCDSYYKKMRRLAYFLTRNDEIANDIAHEAYLATLANRKRLIKKHPKSIDHYMAGIVRNMAFDYHNRVIHLDIDEWMQDKDIPDESDLDDIEREMIADMRAKIATFTQREQECMLLKLDHKMSLDQISSTLGVSRKMVEKSQTSALKKLKEWAKSYWRE